jgi:hypothetical protein
MIRKSVQRFSEKIMLNQRSKARWRFDLIPSRFRPVRISLLDLKEEARRIAPPGFLCASMPIV